MKRFTSAFKWDLVMLWKYGLFYAGLVVAFVWISILLYIPPVTIPAALPVLMFTDIATTGFFFIAIIMFFERSQGSIHAVAVTPLTAKEYILSKLLVLTLFGFGVAMIISGAVAVIRPIPLNWGVLTTGSLLLVIFNILLGFRVVAPYENFTNYLSASAFYLTLLSLPLLDFLGITGDHWINSVFYVFPTHAALLLYKAAFNPIHPLDLVYALVYLAGSIVILFRMALNAFNRMVTGA